MKGTRRRTLLTAIAGTAGVVHAGCLGRRTSGDGDGVTSEPDDGVATAEPDGNELPGECPEYDRVEQVVCYDTVDLEAVDAYLEPAVRAVDPGEEIEFTLQNRSERTLRTNFYNWNVHKHVDEEWFHVAPQWWNDPLMSVEPGAEHSWMVTIDNDGIEGGESVPSADGTEEVTLRGLGGGNFAFRGRGWFEGDGHEDAIAFAATFELDAGPLALTPTDAIKETEREGDTLVARSTRGDPDDEHYRLGVFELQRVDAPEGEPRGTITEQVVRNDQLRDVLALAREHGAEQVRLEEYDGTTPIFGSRSDGVYEFQGSYYDVTTRALEDQE